MFSKFAQFSPAVWGVLAALVLVGVVLLVLKQSRVKWSAQMIAHAALAIALAFVLSFIRFYKMPQGGSITPASMLPIVLFACVYGIGPGLFVGMAYGILQWMQDGFWMLTPVEGIMDYPLAFAMLGMAALACVLLPKDMKNRDRIVLPLGCVIGALCRAIVAVAAGCIFFGEYAPEGTPVIVYSLSYNALYLLPETAICAVIAAAAGPQLMRIMRPQGAKKAAQ